jgi:tRNA threonylcarbamoyladenosine biosynthesis protein TsaB
MLAGISPALTVTDAPLLAIDTAAEYCSVAVAFADRCVAHEERVGQGHSERLVPMVDEVLAEAGLRLGDCAAIAFGAGPGSFTGLRIACAVAQGLGWGAERPLLPVGNLEALAWRVKRHAPDAQRIGIANDARMHEAYWAVFDARTPVPGVLAGPALIAAGELAALFRTRAVDTAAGSALTAFDGFTKALAPVRCLPELRAGAEAIAACARHALAAGKAVPAEQASPLYVRDRVALTVDERAALRDGARETA